MRFAKDWLSGLFMSAFGFIGSVLHLDVYGGTPIQSASVCADVSCIFDFIPVIPIQLDTQYRYDHRWTFPTSYVLDTMTQNGTPCAIAADDKGGTKVYEYDADTNRLMISDGWGASITPEGSIIYHGPRCDNRGEICILVPYGYSLDGTGIAETLEVIESVQFSSGRWMRDSAFDRQVYNILYNTDADPKIITQEVTWDTDTFYPVVKTAYHDEHLNRYDIKHWEALWHQQTATVDEVHKYAPMPVFQGVRRRHHQTRTALIVLEALKAKAAVETEEFDDFRRPEGIPG